MDGLFFVLIVGKSSKSESEESESSPGGCAFLVDADDDLRLVERAELAFEGGLKLIEGILINNYLTFD